MLNNISLMGRLVADPTIRYTKENKPVANFTLAVDRDRIEGTDFIDCVGIALEDSKNNTVLVKVK